MKIRKAILTDKEEILKLVKKLYSKSSPESIRDWEKNYNRLMRLTFVSEVNKKIIGFITYSLEKEAIHIRDLYVLLKYRRKEIATKLLKKVDSLRKNFKKKYLKVNNRKKDKSALKLYQKFGFQIYSIKKSIKLRK